MREGGLTPLSPRGEPVFPVETLWASTKNQKCVFRGFVKGSQAFLLKKKTKMCGENTHNFVAQSYVCHKCREEIFGGEGGHFLPFKSLKSITPPPWELGWTTTKQRCDPHPGTG